MSWRVLVADDEPPARALLAASVRARSDWVLVGECADGPETVAAIRATRPDLVLLDIAMPGLSGFEVIEEVGVEAMPLVVFVTAYDEYAVRAFRAHAFDYLLKPVEPERFAETAERVMLRLTADASAARASGPAGTSGGELADGAGHGERIERLERLLAALEREHAGEARLTVWQGGRGAVLIRTADIDRAEVEGNYVRVYVGAEQHLMRETMSALEARLSSSQFVRLNRSVLVNVDRIREIQPYFHGDFAVVLRDGTTVLTGRTYRERLRRRFRAAE